MALRSHTDCGSLLGQPQEGYHGRRITLTDSERYTNLALHLVGYFLRIPGVGLACSLLSSIYLLRTSAFVCMKNIICSFLVFV